MVLFTIQLFRQANKQNSSRKAQSVISRKLPINTNLQLAQMLESAEKKKNNKTIIISMFQVLKKLSRNMEDTEKNQIKLLEIKTILSEIF